MLWKERQEKIEEFTYNSLEEIANEIGIIPKFYPEVYWVGRKLKFEDLGLASKYKKEFDEIKKKGRSGYFFKSKIILIRGYFLEDIAEEAGHFLHLTTSNINKINLKNVNDFCLNTIIEMFGFFCSMCYPETIS